MTPLQRAFAELAGILLGRRWFEEQRRRAEEKTDSAGNVSEEERGDAKDEAARKS